MQSHGVLTLLQGPTKVAVGAALASGAAAGLALASSNPALCYVERIPYDDAAFQSMHGTLRQRALATSKPQRPVGLHALARIGTPGHLAITFARNIGIATLLRVNIWLAAALAEEEKAEEEGREPEVPELSVADLAVAVHRGAYNACVDLATQTTRAALDARALESMPPALAKKLIKDLRQSAVRKGRLPWYTRSLRVAKTAAFSEATWWAADFVVSCTLELHAALRKAAGTWQQRAKWLAMRCGLHAVRASVVLMAVAAGNGVGALAPRGRGFSMWLCVTLASFYVNGQFFGLITRLAPMPLAGGGAGGGDEGAPGPAGGGAAAGPAAQQAQQAQQPGFLMVGQQVHPAAAMAWAAAAAAQAGGAPEVAQQLADGVAELGAPAEPPLQADAAVGPEDAELAAEQAQQAQQAHAGVQAGGPGAAEPPVPAPQQRRVVGGPRLPDRPGRRNAAVGPEPQPGAAAAAGVGDRGAPQPQAPHTPLYRDQRAPTPAGDSEEMEARAAAAASPGMSPSPATASPSNGAGPSRSAEEEGAAASSSSAAAATPQE
ncbi:hypothetical protein C2E21_5178 [Chlorella sorokiniana]|uniref:Uncharacterized protein n=1 Tax=Chlorella sorokiniana TaxID=3076 RepID=A0A2P6TQJ4_CHLSO|nr:hypothetical protein C2E21_5178 [Chlorella sorokiniana]|eukprot:PRW56300.1 hypothetical protein C2E21_5178 [Chlorella sorokiniana]